MIHGDCIIGNYNADSIIFSCHSPLTASLQKLIHMRALKQTIRWQALSHQRNQPQREGVLETKH